jgi:hypothetical protein
MVTIKAMMVMVAATAAAAAAAVVVVIVEVTVVATTSSHTKDTKTGNPAMVDTKAVVAMADHVEMTVTAAATMETIMAVTSTATVAIVVAVVIKGSMDSKTITPDLADAEVIKITVVIKAANPMEATEVAAEEVVDTTRTTSVTEGIIIICNKPTKKVEK